MCRLFNADSPINLGSNKHNGLGAKQYSLDQDILITYLRTGTEKKKAIKDTLCVVNYNHHKEFSNGARQNLLSQRILGVSKHK